MKYNTPYEVSKQQYNVGKRLFGMIVAHRQSKDKHGKVHYYLKLLLSQYATQVADTLCITEPQ